MSSFSHQFAPFAERMQAQGIPDIFISTFAYYYDQLVAGVTGLMPESDIEPVLSLPDAEQLSDDLAHIGERSLRKTAVIKLNGGLGTGMGLERAKSLLIVKDNLSFLDITARQAIYHGAPLILMDSFNTQKESLDVLRHYPKLKTSLPQTFLQHKEPKVRQSDLKPVNWPANPALEWCPPGHGDIYTALVTSGTLAALLTNGYEYAFVSNADNLGAVVDTRILGYFSKHEIPFMLEVADRTEMDKKGGHLAKGADGRLLLRESAQCSNEDTAAFQDTTRHKYFNTNNLWVHLPTLQRVMVAQNYKLGLPMIRNQKTVDPRDPDSTMVYQLETAMGSAIAIFHQAQAIRVPRTRFAPVKSTNELLAVRSDAYVLTDDFCVIPNSHKQMDRFVVSLDSDYYKFVSDLEMRFPFGVPSLVDCTRFTVVGDVCFGRDVVCRGEVIIRNESGQPIAIPDGTILTGSQIFEECQALD